MARTRSRSNQEEPTPARVRRQPERIQPKGELAETLKSIQKRYGEDTVKKAREVHQPPRISTGIFTLDFALLGGIPESRISMGLGRRSAGKSTVANLIIGNAQRKYPDQTPVILDIEGTFDPVWAEKLGVDVDSLPVVPCESGEMAVDAGDAIVSSLDTSLLVVDSIAALTPMKEIDSSAEDALVGIQARLVGNFIRRVNAALIKERRRGHHVTILFLNQYRSAIGKFQSFGEPLSIPGGKALEYCTTTQIIIKNKEVKGKDENGLDTMSDNEHSFTVEKNKLNNGPRTGEFVLVREDRDGLLEGAVDDSETLLSYAKKFSMVSGAGQNQRIEFGDHSYSFRKISEAVQMLRDDPEIKWELRNEVIRQQAIRLKMPDYFIDSIGE